MSAIEIPIFQLGIFMDKYPVRVDEYVQFDHEYRNPWGTVENQGKLPVTNVSWRKSMDYSEFLGKRLPTTTEWIFCATGALIVINQNGSVGILGDIHRFPWGDDETIQNCNNSELGINHPTPVDYFDDKGESGFGISDMMGNVWEMTASYFTESINGKVPHNKVNDDRTIIGGYFGNKLTSGGMVGKDLFKMDIVSEESSNKIIGFRFVREFGLVDLKNYSVEIMEEYFKFCVKLGGLRPLKRSLICDVCCKEVDPAVSIAIGHKSIGFCSVYCNRCLRKVVQKIVRKHGLENEILVFSPALSYMISYMRGVYTDHRDSYKDLIPLST
jgi:hypothetical protein